MTMMFDAPTKPGFRLAYPDVTPSSRFSGTMEVAEDLNLKYRPTTLAEVFGQDAAVAMLRAFVADPYPKAILMEGSTGLGKTSSAYALANDLGVDRDWGFDFIKSAEADMESVNRGLKMLRHVAPGSGWKVLLIDEAHSMSYKAIQILHSALENLPAKSVICFTTDQIDKFPDSFLDRCLRVPYVSDGPTTKTGLQAAIDRVWFLETGQMDSPDADDLPPDTYRRGILSFRRGIDALNPLIRAAKRAIMPDGPPGASPTLPLAMRVEPIAGPPVNPTVASLAPSLPTPTPKPPTTAPKRPAAVQSDPADTMSLAPNLAERRVKSAVDAMKRLEDESGANAERIRRARRMIEWAGDDTTAAMRAELKSAEREDARLVKAWLAAQAEWSRADRESKKLAK